MGDSEFYIKKLEAADVDQVSRFSMSEKDDKPLQQFLRRKAHKSREANLTQTYVAKMDGDRRVLAYISIMCAEVRLDGAYAIEDKADANQYEYQPAVRIARLACCDEVRGRKLGVALVEMVLGQVLGNIVPHVGCRFIILDAKRKSIGFYRKKFGFRLLETPANKAAENPIMFLDLRAYTGL